MMRAFYVSLRRPRLLDMIHSLQEIPNKHLRVFCRRKVAQARHRLVLAARNLIASLLAHLRSVAPVVLAGQHVHRALLGVDAGHATATVPASEIPDKLSADSSGQR